MAKKQSALTTIGKILALIGGLLMIIGGILSIIGRSLNELLNLGSNIQTGPNLFGNTLGALIAAIIYIVIGIILVFIYINRIKIEDILALGIVVIVLGIVGSSWLVILGGILILIDAII